MENKIENYSSKEYMELYADNVNINANNDSTVHVTHVLEIINETKNLFNNIIR